MDGAHLDQDSLGQIISQYVLQHEEDYGVGQEPVGVSDAEDGTDYHRYQWLDEWLVDEKSLALFSLTLNGLFPEWDQQYVVGHDENQVQDPQSFDLFLRSDIDDSCLSHKWNEVEHTGCHDSEQEIFVLFIDQLLDFVLEGLLA